MANTTITIPDFDFSNFYYAEILEALMLYKRANLPELTDESDVEPSVQLLRAFSLVGHLCTTLLDLLANENTLPTAKLAETVRNMLRLIDYEMSPATPSQTDLIYELSRVFSVDTEIVTERAQAATKKTNDSDAIFFEALESLTIERSDRFSWVLGQENGVFTDYTPLAIASVPWGPWITPATKDSIYWGHKQVMWNTIYVGVTVAMANITGIFEFYDGDWRKTTPNSVTDGGTFLSFDLTNLLGPTSRAGTIVRIQLNSTTAYEDVESVWTGSTNVGATTTLLGQSSPSTTNEDYTIGSDWTEIDVEDGTLDFTTTGEVTYDLPQSITQNWISSEVNGNEAFWIRYRVISVSTPTFPILNLNRMDTGKQYVFRSVTQGRTHTEPTLGSSTGIADQQFVTAKEHFLWDSETVTVDSEVWIRVDNFLNSETESKHYVIKLGENDKATVVFGGDGKGKIPPTGAGNIAITYRYGAENDGNVGSDTVTVDKTGLTYINKLWNPRVATGWKEAEGASEESLELAKIEGPASIRVKEVAIGPDDVEYLAVNFVDDDGSAPFSRALAFEEGFGPKTIELVLVAAGGGLASNTQLENVETYFNGDKYASPPKTKHLVANQEVGAVNYQQKSIDVTATVYGNVTKVAVENQLARVLQPEALEEDGVTWLWDFGETVTTSKINHEIFNISNSISKVEISLPSGDVSLQTRELPVVGTLTITVVTP